MKEFVDKLIERLGEAFHDVNPYVERVVVKIVNQLAEEYKHKYVSIEVYKQVAGERDIAIEQLHELGYEFGQKIN